MVCDWCGAVLTGKQTRWCSTRCKQSFRQPATVRGNRITDQAIQEAKQKFPSLLRDWDADMVTACADRLLPLLTRRIERLPDS